MRRITLTLFAMLGLAAAGCSRQTPLAPTAASSPPEGTRLESAPFDRLERIATEPDGGAGQLSVGRHLVVVPAGSHNALANAIASAGNGGVVVLRSGAHHEAGTVVVNRSVTLIGEPGAELTSAAGAPAPPGPCVLAPALHVTARQATIWGLTFRSTPGDGNTAILIQGGDDALVFHNRILGYQFGVMIDPADRVRVWSNTIVVSGAWQTGAVGDAFGIVVVNGEHTSILRNETSNALFGIWACDEYGEVSFNRAHDNFVGIIMCTVPAGSFQRPDGSLSGALVSCTEWVATENLTTNNLTTGFLVIDRANHNLVVSNASSGNGTYDIELAGDSNRFGFLTPASFNNRFVAGRYPHVEVKNCGNDNTIIGGSLVDNTTHPCD